MPHRLLPYLTEIKLYFINAFTLFVSLSSVEQWLRIILVIVTIFYTLSKMIKKDDSSK
jgi:hypothetical protein